MLTQVGRCFLIVPYKSNHKLFHTISKADMIVLYGSTVNGTRKDDSDIDVAVIYDKFDGCETRF